MTKAPLNACRRRQDQCNHKLQPPVSTTCICNQSSLHHLCKHCSPVLSSPVTCPPFHNNLKNEHTSIHLRVRQIDPFHILMLSSQSPSSLNRHRIRHVIQFIHPTLASVVTTSIHRSAAYSSNNSRRCVSRNRGVNGSKKSDPPPQVVAVVPPSEAGSTHLQRFISVRTFTAVMSLLLIALTAAILLAVTFTFSINAAQDLATAHTRVISKAKGDIEAYLNIPIRSLDAWQYSLEQGDVGLPRDSVNYATNGWSDPWVERLVGPMSATDFGLQYTVMGFADGNAALAVTFPGRNTFRCQVYKWGSRNASNTSQTSTVTNTDYFKANYTAAAVASVPNVYDPRTRGWYALGATAPGVKAWGKPFLSTVPTLPCIAISAGIYNHSGTFLGVASIFLNLDTMGVLLSKLLAIPNVVSFLIDNNNLLLASTYGQPISATTNVTSGSVGSVPSNCLLSDTANGAERSIMTCRESVTSYGYGPLRDLALSDPVYVANGETGGATRVVKLAGHRYYVAVVRIETAKASGMGWRFAMFLPEDEVTGGIVRGRDIAIYCLCCRCCGCGRCVDRCCDAAAAPPGRHRRPHVPHRDDAGPGRGRGGHHQLAARDRDDPDRLQHDVR